MVVNELKQFIRYSDGYKNISVDLLDNITLHESTVAALTRCGIKAGTAFLSENFSRVFGYPRKFFMEGDLQFLINHMHPDDLSAFISFAETSTIEATAWLQSKEKAMHVCISRIKHRKGKWMWIKQRVIVLSVTPQRHIDIALLLFDDCTAEKETQHNEHVSVIEKSRKNSKLLQLLATAGSTHAKREKLLTTLEDHPSLTQREKEVMQLVSQGFSSKEIASKLFISRHTVESHRKHILRKLRVKNAPAMVHQSVVSSI